MALAVYEGGNGATTLAEFFQNTAAAIDFAVANGADVISMSVGACVEPGAYPSLQASVDAALAAGVVLAAAVGNFSSAFNIDGEKESTATAPCASSTGVMLPAAFAGVISVGATVETGSRWSGSLTPTTADLDLLTLMAPGGDSIIPSTKAPPGGLYTDSYSGTSAAAPHVSGAVALIRSINAAISPSEVRQVLIDSADPSGCTKTDPSIPTYEQECGAGRLDAYSALRLTLERHGGTLTQDVTVPAGETWNLGAVTLAFDPGTHLSVEGTLNAEGTLFTAADPALGWNGIRFQPGASGVIENSVIEEVTGGPVEAALVVYDATLTLDDTQVDGTGGYGGIYATGSAADVTVSGATSLIGSGAATGFARGIYAGLGAHVLVTTDGPVVSDHPGGGLHAAGLGSVITVSGGTVENNDGPGALAASGGTVNLWRGADQGDRPIEILGNDGGLEGDTGAFVGTDSQDNSFADNGDAGATLGQPGARLDALSRDYSSLDAENVWWGETKRENVSDDTTPGSTLDIDPIRTSPPATSKTSDAPEASGAGGPATAHREADGTLHGQIALAERLRVEGDADGASLALSAALAGASGEDDRALVATAAARLLGDPRLDARSGVLGAWASTASDVPNPDRAWARRALSASRLAGGDRAGARAAAVALTESGAAHEAFAHHLLTRLAIETRDEAGALVHLGALASLDADAAAEIALAVAIAFPGSDAAAVLRGASEQEAGKAGDGAAPASLAVAVAPNPFRGEAEVLVSVPDAAAEVRLDVFDALGRRVATLAPDGTGPVRRVRLDASRLAPGVYVARASAGGESAAVARFTVVR